MAALNLNKVILVGRLTAEPELKTTPSGIFVTRFTVAVNRRYTKADQQQQADFISVVAWRQSAEFVSKYFHKGNSICVMGSIQTGSYTDQNGQKRYTTEVVADDIQFVDSKGDSTGSSYRQSNAPAYTPDSYGTPSYQSGNDTAPQFEEMSNEDDLPF